MADIYSRGHIPILTGGTGFYIQAVTRDIDFTEAEQENGYRKKLEAIDFPGAEALHRCCGILTPKAPKRSIRTT